MTGETKRQIEHMLPLIFAFALRYLTFFQAVLCCLAALVDAASTLAGRAWGNRKIPWAGDKTWVGALAFLFSAWAGSLALVYWTVPGTGAVLPVAWLTFTACGLAAAAG